MKVIFLDLDGVLNSRAYDRIRDWSELTYIDETRLPLLKEIVDATGAVIVFTSTWRADWEPDVHNCDEDGRYITNTLGLYGLKIYDKTPDLGISADRGDEIRAWFADNGGDVTDYVIIDDCNADWRDMIGHFVKTSMYVGRGLESEHVQKAIDILNCCSAVVALGKAVHVVIDRPLGSRHPEHNNMVYAVNYGYVPDVIGGDGEEQDAYVLGVDAPVAEFDGVVAAVIRRNDDNEDKWVVVPVGFEVTADMIREKTNFCERYFDSRIIM